MVTYDQCRKALDEIHREILPIANRGYLGYAIAYIEAVDSNATMWAHEGITKEQALKSQVLYVLNNLSAWKGPKAQEMKAILKEYCRG